ncbi:hypothetical protein CEUSTIGMA_g5057.t1 [Chlamydomonas eustigma]|uniref:CCT domain-containing protein n=1 Tax=Chlamydomonas eustigma TaxID=1157962 RepID=A0A250X3G0_9CHLO|nr:hypothetical protein CEUSTIGMA_g5057.t1 [Chlamydomonas eustigma]|eukprot:GAX77613.1 hypothetical protein CEUSTIGMA_g5057.t1 [Chlamydomonas eustigma]
MSRSCQVCAASATHFCANDEAFLCGSCNASIHSANILASRHKVLTIHEYLSEENHLGHSQTSASPTPLATSDADIVSLTGTEGVVPVMDAPPPSKGPTTSNYLEMFDLGDSWLDKFEGNGLFDFSDVIMDESEGLALVPTGSNFMTATEFPSMPSLEGYNFKMSDNEDEDNLDLLVPTMNVPFKVEEEEEEKPVHLPTSRPIVAHRSVPFQMPAPVLKVSRQQAAINRAERVALFREKKKNRKFEKTIRYASRKAYAEVRPRIKGRFAKPGELLALQASLVSGEEDAVVPCF